MALSVNEIQTGVVRTLNNLIGKDACSERQLVTNPVIKARAGGSKLSYPFIVIDKLPLRSYGIDGVYDINYYEFGDYRTELKNYVVTLTIDCHGSTEDDVQSIMQQVRDILYTQYGMEYLSTNTGGEVLSLSDPSFTFNYLQTEYEEVSRVTLELSVTSVFEDNTSCPSTGEITVIEGSGEVGNKSTNYTSQ